MLLLIIFLPVCLSLFALKCFNSLRLLFLYRLFDCLTYVIPYITKKGHLGILRIQCYDVAFQSDSIFIWTCVFNVQGKPGTDGHPGNPGIVGLKVRE